MYSKEHLKLQLAQMGLKPTEAVMIHSSIKAMGPMEGGADTILDALMEYFAEGLLMMPTHTWAQMSEVLRGYIVQFVPTSPRCSPFPASYPQHSCLRAKCARICGR